MNISLEYFLIVAQEQGISRGAERAMVSQQDMSNHIRGWRSNMDGCLTAVPNLLLLQPDQAVLDTYLQVRMLERNLTERLQDLKESTVGKIRLGLHIARRAFCFQRFWSGFPFNIQGSIWKSLMEIPLFLSSCWSRATCICFLESIPQFIRLSCPAASGGNQFT